MYLISNTHYVFYCRQIGIVGPVIYLAIHKYLGDRMKIWIVVLVTLILAAALALEEALLWDWTEVIFGVEHSVPLMTIFLMGGVDTTAGVVYPHYMALYNTQYIASIYIGESISAFSTGLLGLFQGVGSISCVNQTDTNQTNSSGGGLIPVTSPPNFSITVFYMVILVIILLSTGSFLLVHFHKAFAHAKYRKIINKTDDSKLLPAESQIQKLETTSHADNIEIAVIEQQPMSGLVQLYLLLTLFWSSLLVRSVHFTVNIYSCQSYGTNAYSYSSRGCFILRPIAVGLVLLLRVRSLLVISLLVIFYTLMEAYLIYAALMNPNPPLRDELKGEILIVSKPWITHKWKYS